MVASILWFNILIRVEIENGGRKAKVSCCYRGRRWRGVHRGHSQVPCGMAIRGGRRQTMCHPALHMSQRSIWCSSNTYLAMNIIR